VLFLRSEDDRIFRFELPFIWWHERDNSAVEGHIELMKTDPGFFEHHHNFFFDKWGRGETVQLHDVGALSDDDRYTKELHERFHTKSVLSIPISVEGSTMGVLFFATTQRRRNWPTELIPRLRLFGEVFVNAMARRRAEEKLQAAFTEIRQLWKTIWAA
jgi:hypothetical protein